MRMFVQVVQSNANISGLIGKTEIDEAKTSMIAEATNDAFASPIEKVFMEKDAEKKVPWIFLLNTDTSCFDY